MTNTQAPESTTYDMLYSETGKYWTQYAILGREEALATVKRAEPGMVMAVGNMETSTTASGFAEYRGRLGALLGY